MTTRAWTEDDTAMLLAWYIADPDFYASMGGEGVVNLESIQASIGERMSADAILAIDDDGELIGMVSVFPRIGPDSGVVHIGIAPSHRGKGIQAARIALESARQAGYHHLVAPPAPSIDSRVHQAWLRRAGFTVKHHGEWHA